MLPLQPHHPNHHVELQLLEAANRTGLHMRHEGPTTLGVTKVVASFASKLFG